MDFPVLETERLRLVEIGKEHTESYFSILSREDVTKYYGMDSLMSLEDAAKIIASFAANFNCERSIRWGIVLKENDEFIGTLGLNNLNKWSKKAEIGYEIHPHYWRKGYTSEAVKAVLAYAFEELLLFRVGAVTFPANDSSNNLLKKLGFQREGYLRGYLYQNQQSYDAFIFSLLATEWTKRKLSIMPIRSRN
ncbi:GNAT family N-acetyltransferase [Caldibacillus lycopersici]|uniref:GNAT family N-acetyltransferase n=1 Tax=Perspicuibacillus lycopersici TaxID=1325689 RepID=A0AAE3IS06_9BACI|nr:GNAT family N-acetyltransferase [Perspicuibacillus lycopersici]MCU9613550.1 GNAT family N-acetyltransferase [Perspicuibacillus lycopersici]